MIHKLEKGEQRFGLHVIRVSRISFWGLLLRSGIFTSLHEGVTTSQLPLSPSLCTLKRKVQYFAGLRKKLWTECTLGIHCHFGHLFPEGGEPISVFDFIGLPGEDSDKIHCN